ncbi:MAG: Asp-tRNA(Asn)/Glu-tRNA(Gln) amidotransferase subunit GatB [Deltaproteobacteria bacterium]|nr:Asp-tRNA(Asn)/Glu-tRNA(Gln) amidotransferase subunit GatB [Deltaproteobacteria bacterium]
MDPAYEAVIGLEVHAQLLTRTKIFCGCPARFGASPNTLVCPVCLGLPGALPVLNREALALGVKVGLALGCRVRARSVFARKNYFYPDLPKGYQISQFDLPLCEDGALEVPLPDGGVRVAGIARAHLEEDAGKSLHDGAAGGSRVDLNRAGTPLLEIVGRPDLRSAWEAAEYLRQLRDLLLFLGVNDGNMEEGSFRCDANVSVRRRGDARLGTRVELKNINSFRFVQRALEWELADQVSLVAAGGHVEAWTKTWDEANGRCVRMRRKETSEDYRYFTDPDLRPAEVPDALLEAVRASLPELPREKRRRYEQELGLSPADARTLTEHPAVAGYFEALGGDPRRAANWVLNTVRADAAFQGLDARFPVSAERLRGLFALLDEGRLSTTLAREVYQHMAASDQSAEEVVRARGLALVSDPATLEATLRPILAENAKQVALYRAGRTNLLGFFKGAAMKATQGRADPRALDEVLRRLLEGSP